MSVLPAQVKYATVTGVLTSAVVDGADADLLPDSVPLSGQVTFTPDRVNGQLLVPTATPKLMVTVKPMPFLLSGDGSFSANLVVIPGATYTVSFALTGATIAPFSIGPLTDGTTYDLASLAPVTAMDGIAYVIQATPATDASIAAYVTTTPAGPTRTALDAAFAAKDTAHIVEGTGVTAWRVIPATVGAVPFEVAYNSYPNIGAGAGTKNHATFFGYNVGRHGGGPVVAGKNAWIMGFEDNYYDYQSTLKYGPEWYIEYWSPDGASVQMFRPFYCRLEGSDTNTAQNSITRMDFGSDGVGSWSVHAGYGAANGQRLSIVPAQTLFTNAPVNIKGDLTVQNQVTGDFAGHLRVSGARTWDLRGGNSANDYAYFVVRDVSAAKDRLGITVDGVLVVGDPPNLGVGGTVGAAIAMGNVTTAPATNPAAAGVLYVQAGSLKFKGSSGTVTTLAVA